MLLRGHHRSFPTQISKSSFSSIILASQPASVQIVTARKQQQQHQHRQRQQQRNTTFQFRACSQLSKPFRLPQQSIVSKASHSTKASNSGATAASSKDPLIKYKALSATSPASNMSDESDTYSVAFEHNSQWRRNLADSHPELFEKLGKGQAPQILWIGCADSRCPETTILGLQPGDIFCHRNIANILIPTDLNSLSVIQFAVQYLKVKHIIVCGHTSCGGVAAALDNKKLGLIDTWLMPLRQLRQQNLELLSKLEPAERALKLVDLNVRNSVSTLLQNPTVIEAMVEHDLKVHGVIYNVGNGELNELDITEDDELVAARKNAFKTD